MGKLPSAEILNMNNLAAEAVRRQKAAQGSSPLVVDLAQCVRIFDQQRPSALGEAAASLRWAKPAGRSLDEPGAHVLVNRGQRPRYRRRRIPEPLAAPVKLPVSIMATKIASSSTGPCILPRNEILSCEVDHTPQGKARLGFGSPAEAASQWLVSAASEMKARLIDRGVNRHASPQNRK
jgi:hypothetical protein